MFCRDSIPYMLLCEKKERKKENEKNCLCRCSHCALAVDHHYLFALLLSPGAISSWRLLPLLRTGVLFLFCADCCSLVAPTIVCGSLTCNGIYVVPLHAMAYAWFASL